MDAILSTGLIGISLGAQYAMISIGFPLIFGIMGVINFMHGGGYVLGGYFTFVFAKTLGLPFVRTSPDHGTAFDIAGQGKADPASLVAAIRLAARMSMAGAGTCAPDR